MVINFFLYKTVQLKAKKAKPNVRFDPLNVNKPNVRFSDVHCTVDVRNPDVLISAFSKSVRFVICPDFRQLLITGRFRLVIGHPVHFNPSLRLSDVQFQLYSTGQPGAETGSKPVWNRFRHSFRSRTSEIGLKSFPTKQPGAETGSKPIWNRFGTGFGTWLSS